VCAVRDGRWLDGSSHHRRRCPPIRNWERYRSSITMWRALDISCDVCHATKYCARGAPPHDCAPRLETADAVIVVRWLAISPWMASVGAACSSFVRSSGVAPAALLPDWFTRATAHACQFRGDLDINYVSGGWRNGVVEQSAQRLTGLAEAPSRLFHVEEYRMRSLASWERVEVYASRRPASTRRTGRYE